MSIPESWYILKREFARGATIAVTLYLFLGFLWLMLAILRFYFGFYIAGLLYLGMVVFHYFVARWFVKLKEEFYGIKLMPTLFPH